MEHFTFSCSKHLPRAPRACPRAAGRARGAPAPADLWPASRCPHFRGQDRAAARPCGQAARLSSSNAQFRTLPSVTCCLHSSPRWTQARPWEGRGFCGALGANPEASSEGMLLKVTRKGLQRRGHRGGVQNGALQAPAYRERPPQRL